MSNNHSCPVCNHPGVIPQPSTSVINYAILGRDTVYSTVPVVVSDTDISLEDAMYDLADSPLYQEAIFLVFPVLLKDGEYFNPKTRLYMRLEEE